MKKKAKKIIKILITLGSLAIVSYAIYFKIIPFFKKYIFTTVAIQKEETKPIEYLYEIPIDDYFIIKGIIKPNQNFSQILSKYNISVYTIDTLLKNYKHVFNIKKIIAGNKYAAFCYKDSINPQLKYFVYELNPVEYLFFSFVDSVSVVKKQKPLYTQRRLSFGKIKSSLWHTIKEQNLSPYVAIELSEIYAWSIDFFGLQKGDYFKVIYDENFVDDKSIGIGKIYGAYFNHAGKEYYAIPFEQDGHLSYFDISGKSLKKAFLKAPLRFSRISSYFSNSRYHPVLKIYRPHHGVDYSAPQGTPVYSIGNGTVIKKDYQAGGGGKYIKIRHNSIYTSVYMHLSGYAKNIAVGSSVSQGQLIGYVGSTGIATGPHLDFRIYKNGTPTNPLKIESPPMEPIYEANRTAFYALRDSIILELNRIPTE